MKKPLVIWEPWPGSQQRFLSCPAWECLLHGNRGGGKTDVLIMDYLQDVGKGFGSDYKGLLLREATTELGDVITKTRKWIPRIFPLAKYNGSKKIWTFPEGETLWLNYARTVTDYEQYHGHEYCVLDTSHILLPNDKTIMAKDIKIGDLVQTLQGPKKITKIFHYKKPAIRISVFDSDLNLIGSQVQGVLHPLLYSNGEWQQPGLSYVLKTFLQQKPALPLIEEVYKFLRGIDQEIFQLSHFVYTKNFDYSAIVKLMHVQYSYLNQIFQQFLYTIIHFCEDQGFHFCIDQENFDRQFFSLIQEISDAKFVHEFQNVLQLLLYCVSLRIRVLQIQINCVHQNHSNEFYEYDTFSLLKKQKYLTRLHNILLNIQNFLHNQKPFELKLDLSELNDILPYVLLDFHKESSLKDDCLFYKNLCGEKLHQDLISVLSFFPKSKCVQQHSQFEYSRSGVDFDYVHPYQKQVIHTASQHFDNFCHDKSSFSFSPLNSPVNMIDFEVQDANNYITELDYKQYNNRFVHKSQRKFIVSKNCWIGWEELTNHPFDTVYLKLMSCNRSSNKKIIPKYRGTCNPSGPGHQWVKQRFIDTTKVGKIYKEKIEFEFPDPKGEMVSTTLTVTRTHVQSFQSENKSLAEADPLYMAKIYSLTKDDEMLRKAWIDGSWDLLIGGFFTDVWDKNIHVLPTFKVPKSWRLIRSFDWGSSKPWAVTYGFETNGEQPDPNAFEPIPYIPKGSMIVPTEIYGWNGIVNEGDQAISSEIAERVLDVDAALFTEYGIKCTPGPADTSIYEVRDGTSIGANLATHGCHWTRAYKGSGSRIAGWAIIRQMLGAAKRKELETPHLYFFPQAEHHIRTLPIMQRDPKKPEDIETSLEDHCFVYDTKIITDKGVQKIGDLVGQVGKVLSVNGEFVDFYNCRLIKKNQKIIKVTFADGFSVKCTEDHKFLTTKVCVEAKNLLTFGTLSDTSLCIVGFNTSEGERKWSEEKEKQLLFCQTHNKSLMRKFITNVVNIFKKMEKNYIHLYGSIIKEKFQKGFIYIIKNQDQKIILETYRNLQQINTYPYTKQDTPDLFQKNAFLKHQNGIKEMKEKNGMINIMKIQKKHCIKKLKECALFVGNILLRIEKMLMPSVPTTVKQSGEKKQELIILKESVKYVPLHLQQINIQKQEPVHVFAGKNLGLKVKSIEFSDNEDVYCLIAKGTHTFALENGVIVSNCMDSLRYLIARKLTTMKRRPVKN